MENTNNTNNVRTNNNQQKSYSFFRMVRAIGSKGSQFVFCAGQGKPFKVSGLQTSQGGKNYVTATMRINGKGEYLQTMCGINPDDQDGGSWARLTFWERAAERFVAYTAKHPNSVITFTGSVKVTQNQGQDGKTYNNVNITVDDFTHVRDISANGNNSQQAAPTQTSAAPQQNSAPQGYVPASSNQGFVEIDDDDDDLPF